MREMKIVLKEQLKKILNERGIKVVTLARDTKVPVATIHGWAQGKPPRNVNQIKAVCDHLDVSLEWLLYGENKKSDLKILNYHQDEINAGVWEVVLRKPILKRGANE